VGAKGKDDKQSSSDTELLESIARSLSLLVKLQVKNAQGKRKLNEMILELNALGCRPVEIADALGKTPNDVNPVLSRARKGGTSRKSKVSRKAG